MRMPDDTFAKDFASADLFLFKVLSVLFADMLFFMLKAIRAHSNRPSESIPKIRLPPPERIPLGRGKFFTHIYYIEKNPKKLSDF